MTTAMTYARSIRTVARRGLLALAAGACLTAFAAPASAAFAVATTIQGFVITFDTDAPNNILSSFAVSGLASNEVVVGIDTRPADGSVIALGSFGNLYGLNAATGVATPIAPLTNASGGAPVTPNGTNFGVDFNPTVDRLRVVSNADQNLRINPVNGVTIIDTPLSYVSSPTDPNVVDVAYTNNRPGATTTTLYGIDAGTAQLVSFVSPNAGTLQPVGPLGFDINELGGFDISGVTGEAFAALIRANESQSRLFRINLATGTATDLGQIGGGPILTSFTLTAIPEPTSLALLTPTALLLTRRRA